MAQTLHQANVESWGDNKVQRRDGVAVTMNCGEGSETKTFDTSESSSKSTHLPVLFANLWQQDKNVDIILLQECPRDPTCLNQTIELLEKQSDSKWERVMEVESNMKCPKANVIIFNANRYKRDNSKNARTSTFDINIGDIEKARRHAYCRLKAIGVSGFEMDVLSFHGVENDATNKGKRSIYNKQHILEEYINSLYMNSNNYKIPILIGGDWNVEINPDFVERPSKSTARVWKPAYVDNSCKRFQKPQIDYFVVIDYWGMYRSDKTIRLLNMLDTPVARAHTDHRRAQKLDHDPIFVPYQTLALDENPSFVNGKPVFPSSFVSNSLNTETVRLRYDVNVIFPKRCMEQTIASVTWGQLLEERKDEIVLRYYCHRRDEYFHGSQISPAEDEDSQSGIMYSGETISITSLHEYIKGLVQDKAPDGRRKTEITLSDLQQLNTRNKNFLSSVFTEILLYSGGLPTKTAANKILHKILQEKDCIWPREDMHRFIDAQLQLIEEETEEPIVEAFASFSRDQKVKFLFDVQLLLGYELSELSSDIRPKAMTLENLGSLLLPTLQNLFKKHKQEIRNLGKVTKPKMCQHILTAKNDLLDEMSSLQASKAQQKYSESLQNFQQLAKSDDILYHHMEDPESQVSMLTLTCAKWNFERAMDISQVVTPDQSDLKAQDNFNSTGGLSEDVISSKSGSNSATASGHQDTADTRRSLEKQFDQADEKTIHQVIKADLVAIHDKLREMKNLPTAVMNMRNLQELQRRLKMQNMSLGSLLDERIREGGISGEYSKFKRENPGSYAYTSYIMKYLVAKVEHKTMQKRGFLQRAFSREGESSPQVTRAV
jgi:hypothetical protein